MAGVRETIDALRNSFLFGIWLVHLFFANILLSLLLPLSIFLPDLVYDLASLIAYSVWQGIQSIFVRTNGAHITISGLDALPEGESAIVVANHVSWTDFYLIQEVAGRAKMLSRCRWFAKRSLKWVPFLGWGLWAMGMPLVSRKWTEDKNEMQRVFSGVVDRKWPIWLVSFSEGTRYSSKKRLEAEAWCRQNGKALGSHLLYPRTKGFVSCVQELRKTSHVKAVYDMTIAYAKLSTTSASSLKPLARFQYAPTFTQSVFQSNLDDEWRLHVQVNRYSLESLPTADADLAKRLENRWVEKGEYLTELEKQMARQS